MHNKINKTAVYATVRCGMIRDDPGMLRLVGAHCVGHQFLYGRGKRDRERKEKVIVTERVRGQDWTGHTLFSQRESALLG